MRQTPWETVGMSRATWYRRGKPTKPHKRITAADTAKHVGFSSTRTYYRTMRVLQSDLAPLVASGQLSVARADLMLRDPEKLRRFFDLLARMQKPPTQ